METVASFPCCAFFYPVGLGLFIKTDDNKSRSGGPCSELLQPVGECTDPGTSQLLSHLPGRLREAGLGVQFLEKRPPGVGCGAQEAADPSCVILELCCFPSLLLKLQMEVCNLSFTNCWKEAAFCLWTQLRACLASCHFWCRNLRNHRKPDVGRERC